MKLSSTWLFNVSLGVPLALMAAFATPSLAETRTTTRKTQTSTTAASTRSWVTLRAATDRATYAPGEPIQVRLTATNTFRRGAYLRFTSGQRFDFSVYPAGQRDSVYTWSATRMFAQNLGSLWLKPGQSQHYQETIGDEMGSLKPGKYRLVASLANVPRRIVAPPIEFEVK